MEKETRQCKYQRKLPKSHPKTHPVQSATKLVNTATFLFNSKEKTTVLEKSGIYRVTCEHCNAVYVKETQWNFKLRYNKTFKLR